MRGFPKSARWTAIGIFAVLATTVTFTLISGPFGYGSVCDKCGAIRHTKDWQLPGTEITVFTHSRESDSPLSRVLLTNGIVQTHEHHWLFAQGGGHGVKCAIGPGRHILPTIERKEFATLVLTLHQRGQIAFRDRVVRAAFDPDTSDQACKLSFFDAPTAATSASEMQNWIVEQSEYLDEAVALCKKQ